MTKLESGTLFAKLPPLDGRLLFDNATRNAYAQDTGQIVHEEPIAVLLPGSVEDISRVVNFARRSGLRIAARGEGHQPFGQAQVRGGIVIDMRSLQSVHSVAGDALEVDAGADWRTVTGAALGNGLTPPVLPNFLGLTVGGTLSIGGVGLATFRHGAQVDQVRALEVVTGQGEVIRCSEERHRDLFEAALAGQGQCAVTARATLRLEPAPANVREFTLHYPELPTLFEDGLRLIQDERFDGLVAILAPVNGQWAYLLTAISYFTPPNLPDDAALLAGLRFAPGTQKVRNLDYLQYFDVTPPMDPTQFHASLGLCVPHSVAASFVADMLPRLTAEDLGPVDAIRLFFWKRKPFRRPLLRLPEEPYSCYLALLRTETSDTELLARMLAGNRTLFELNRNIGGTLYPFAAVEMTESDWRRNYGPSWPALLDARRRYDSEGVFASGPDLRVPP